MARGHSLRGWYAIGRCNPDVPQCGNTGCEVFLWRGNAKLKRFFYSKVNIFKEKFDLWNGKVKF